MRSDYVHINGRKLHFLQWGSGERLLLAFHGYANHAGLFNGLEPLLKDRYTVVSVDLPYHGKSVWEPSNEFSPDDLIALADHFRKAYDKERFSLLGFSLGGRMSLYLIQERPQWVDQAVLMAPDGLAFNTFYYFVTRTWSGQSLFANMLQKPDRYFRFIDLLHRRKWLDPSRYKFLMHYLETPDARRFLGDVWPSLRFIIPEKKKVQEAVRKHHIPLHLVMGRYDRVIPLKLAERLAAGVADIHLHVLEKGHKLLDEETAALVAAQLS